MAASHKHGDGMLEKPKNQEPATFKNSLRTWQARWKAQKDTVNEEPHEPTDDNPPPAAE